MTPVVRWTGLATLALLTACAAGSRSVPLDPIPTTAESPSLASDPAATTTDLARDSGPATDDRVPVRIRAGDSLGPISPFIRGLSGGVDQTFLSDVGATVNSWGGNPATRFNFDIGHAWNAGRDWEYRNGNYDQSGDAAVDFGRTSQSAGAVMRLAVPTIGWVAKNDDNDTCSFPTGDGGCEPMTDHDCANPGPIADPTVANVQTTPLDVAGWVARLIGDEDLPIDFIAMDNEPELWGINHYDVHPSCTTYEEVLLTYLSYATAIRLVAPDAQLLGPVACCWFDYWGIAPGTADGEPADYLSWFLEQVRLHDEATGSRSLDLLDVHFYPQTGVYNDDSDPITDARRLRSTRALWDPNYRDESWIDTPIVFIPRMLDTIAASYPGTGLAISEWNFGADGTMNGGLAIAEVLGIYGREGVDMASYWMHPPEGSPGYFAFKMYGNYDSRGSSFDGDAVSGDTDDLERVSIFAAVDRAAGLLRVMLLNKDPERAITTPVSVDGVTVQPAPKVYRYSEASPDEIVAGPPNVGGQDFEVDLPPSSITLIELGIAP